MSESKPHPQTGNITQEEAEDILFNASMTKQVKDEKVREFINEYEGAK